MTFQDSSDFEMALRLQVPGPSDVPCFLKAKVVRRSYQENSACCLNLE
jgi:hypothetical protein